MKILAYTEPNDQSELLTVYQALARKKNDPDKWEGKRYYDIIRFRPMYPVNRIIDRQNRSSFSYVGGNHVGHTDGSKGIAHELAQEFLVKQSKLHISIFKKEFNLDIIRAEDEYHIYAPDNPSRKAFIDVMLWLDPNSPHHGIFGDQIAVEITDTHQNTNKKIKLLKDLGISSLEIKLISDWHIDNNSNISSEQLSKLRRRIIGFWNAKIYCAHLNSIQRI